MAFLFLGTMPAVQVEGKNGDMRDQVIGMEGIPDGKATFNVKTKATKVSSIRVAKKMGGVVGCYPYCCAHKECKRAWHIVQANPQEAQALGITVDTEKFLILGEHAEEESADAAAKQKRDLRRTLSMSEKPAAARATLVEEGKTPPELVPSLSSIRKHAAYERQRVQVHTETVEDLELFRQSRTPQSASKDTSMWFSNPQVSPLILPFTSSFNLQEVVAFISRSPTINLVLDFTHDVCRQRYKVGVLAVLGTHFSQSEWKGTVIPLIFAVSEKENEAAYDLVVRNGVELLEEQGISLAAKVQGTYSDGHAGCHSSLLKFFPQAQRHHVSGRQAG